MSVENKSAGNEVKQDKVVEQPMPESAGVVTDALSGSFSAIAGEGIESQAAVLQRMDDGQRQNMLTRISRVRGNQHVQRLVAAINESAVQTMQKRVGGVQLEGEEAGAEPAAGGGANIPAESALIPFDPNPMAAPGERILFNCSLTDPSPNDYKLEFTSQGGNFDTMALGPTKKTVNGLRSGNISFYIDENWDGTTPVTVRLEVQRTSDNSVTNSKDWFFSKKTNIPTEITQQETENERPLPSVYSYKIGPDLAPTAGDDYLHYTILETFGQRSCNITMDELKSEFKKAYPEITNQAQITAHFFGTSSNNGTFTVSEGDMIYDRHSGGMPDSATFEAALTTMKEINVDLPQTYEAEPGVALGNYTIRRILKTDGTKKVKKMAVAGP
ncbi:MAG: hypothetical protein JXA42_23775 [Anaerolineales bacterium]|nr:hypothetical protein [Anaerolineales bacterium]